MLYWKPAKDVSAVINYRWLPAIDDGDTLATATLALVSGNVNIDMQDADTTGVTIYLSGGTVGNCIFKGSATSGAGLTIEEYISVQITDYINSVNAIGVYGNAADFLTYHVARGNDLPDATSDPIATTAALVVASDWLDGRYRTAFGGYKVGMRSQYREWPRYNAFDIYGYLVGFDAVPVELVNAAYEIALRQLQKPGSLNVDFTPNKYTSARVEGAVSVSYRSFSSASDVQTQYNIVDNILYPILTGHGAASFSPLSGAASRV